jgi:hypothetical protein
LGPKERTRGEHLGFFQAKTHTNQEMREIFIPNIIETVKGK